MKVITVTVSLCVLLLGRTAHLSASLPAIQTVFIILMENHDWVDIQGSGSAPYINTTLLPASAHADQYYNPPGNHPSLPNYLWLEAGQNFGILDDNDPSSDHQSTTAHLVTRLEAAGVTWKAYDEGIDGTTCPLSDTGQYAVRHNPFVYFDDVTASDSQTAARCIAHIRPYAELAADLQQNRTARYNFITPNLCHDMHNCAIASGDAWLSTEMPKIMASAAYQHAAVFITWDESENADGPIGMIVVSPFAKRGYSNSIHYTHSSTLRTVQEIFGLTPLLGDAKNATDLSDLFGAGTLPAAPTNLHIVGS
ncbi:MAG TPA: alkaline phosphatase family protein [Vicinamibacterales bacterium]|jgi:phospholipase C